MRIDFLRITFQTKYIMRKMNFTLKETAFVKLTAQKKIKSNHLELTNPCIDYIFLISYAVHRELNKLY